MRIHSIVGSGRHKMSWAAVSSQVDVDGTYGELFDCALMSRHSLTTVKQHRPSRRRGKQHATFYLVYFAFFSADIDGRASRYHRSNVDHTNRSAGASGL